MESTDLLPASFHYYDASREHVVVNPADDMFAFVQKELSLGRLGEVLKHLWLAGGKHPATQLHFQVAIGREIVVADRMDLHLIWSNDGRVFLKPIPGFLLDETFWQRHLRCPDACACKSPPPAGCRADPRKVALGFLYTYACLISSETDFFLANEKRLLPRRLGDATIEWKQWKKFARELLARHEPDKVHPRFLRAELRLSRINNITRFTRFPPFHSYIRGWNNYGGFSRDFFSWTTTAIVFVALVLTAMQVGLATERLQSNAGFQQASYGFTIFAILGPMCAFGLAVLGALVNVAKDLPKILKKERAKAQDAPSVVLQPGQDLPSTPQSQNPPAKHQDHDSTTRRTAEMMV